ncbi:hypothetical protein GCM10022240_04200 [Microbacterium kribbense]|uniref:Uncharacterized protein n=1 Tax=Microbacterium kribbense TaxID=433645 RepID=A0ABP7G4J5_9MICO
MRRRQSSADDILAFLRDHVPRLVDAGGHTPSDKGAPAPQEFFLVVDEPRTSMRPLTLDSDTNLPVLALFGTRTV